MSTSSAHLSATSGLTCDETRAEAPWLRTRGKPVEGDVFITPVPVGSRLRARSTLTAITELDGGAQGTLTTTIEVEGAAKPAAVGRVHRQIPGLR